ncbi:MAG: alkaline phosphatase [Fibrobacter sp.]|nr:alkaline phosphatase [Fibrobacter sp.]
MIKVKTVHLLLGVLLAAGMGFAQTDSAPFQKGNSLELVSRISLKTAEIAAFMPEVKKLFVVGDANAMEVVDLTDAKFPKSLPSFILDGEATSVTVHGNLIAASLLANPAWGEGSVEIMEFVDGNVRKVSTIKACFHPDMITFTPDGSKLLVACEGEPSEERMRDPFGAVGFVDMNRPAAVTVLPFDDVTIEPEYITVSKDSRWAWVSLQENNALAKVDLLTNKIAGIFDLGFVDHSQKGFALDAVKDGKIDIKNEFMWGLRQPDGIKAFEEAGRHYVLTANEGEDCSDTQKTYGLKDVASLAKEKGVKLKFGSRSVSLFDGMTGKLLWDSGETFERVAAEVAPEYFNWNAKKGKKKADARSDDKGSEPENITVGYVRGPDGNERRLVFVGLERMSGIAVFDFTDIKSPKLIDYFMDPKDRGPEGLIFISAEESPIAGQPLLIVGYEYSKTLVVYAVK